MNIFLITFQAVAALLGIGVVGFYIIGRRHLPNTALSLLTSIAIDIALPCLVLGNILVAFSPEEFPDWWRMPLWWIGFTVVTLILSFLAAFLIRKEFRGEFIMSLLFQNGIFLPVVILAGLFRDPAIYLVSVFLFIFLQPSLVFSTYSLFFGSKAGPQALSWRRIVNPVLVMTIIGIIIALLGVRQYVPAFVVTILITIGAMAVPLFMLILGGNIYNDFTTQGKTEGAAHARVIYAREAAIFTVIKNLVFPLIFIGLLILLKPDYVTAIVIFLQAAVPPITAIPILTERSGGNRAIASQFVLASFVFSIISIPAVIILFNRFFPFPAGQ